MQMAREHHYVPKCVSKRFAGADGYLHGYCKNEQRFIKRVPKKLFVCTDLHSQFGDGGIVDDIIERQLSKVETKAAQILDLLVRSARLGIAPQLTYDQYDCWTSFFLLQWKRAPEFHDRARTFNEFDRVLDELLDEYAAKVRPITAAERARFKDPDVIARMKHNAIAMNVLRLGAGALGVLRNRGIALFRVTAVGESLLIGSNPVMKLTPAHTNHLADSEVEVWLPIAPDVLVGAGTAPNAVQFGEISGLAHVAAINDDLLAQSSVVAGRSRLTVQAVLQRNGLTAPAPCFRR